MLKTNIHHATHKKQLKLNVKAKPQDMTSHSYNGKHKSNLGFPLFEGMHFRLLCTFLELEAGHHSLIPRFSAQARYPEKALCLWGPGAPLQPTGAPTYAEAHTSINQGINQGTWLTLRLRACTAADAAHKVKERFLCRRQLWYFTCPSDQDPCSPWKSWVLPRATGISCLLFGHFPFFFTGFWWFPHLDK